MEGVMVAGGGARVPLSKLPKPQIHTYIIIYVAGIGSNTLPVTPKEIKWSRKEEKKILRNKNQRLNCSFLIIGYMCSSKDQ